LSNGYLIVKVLDGYLIVEVLDPVRLVLTITSLLPEKNFRRTSGQTVG